MSDQNTDTQRLALKNYCQQMDYQIIEEYIDNGFSGSNTKRPAFERLLKDMREGKVSCILVFKTDRIGRSLLHLLSFLQELRNRKVDFISLTEMINTTTPQGELIWSILGAFGQYERSIIIERTKAGLARARAEGKQIGRPKGKKDSRPREKEGYFRRWAK
jgi:DNA invertase Pin-like site-specific DNA recombinase